MAYIRSHYRYRVSTHLMANMTIDLGDAEADVETYAIAYLVFTPSGSAERVITRGLRYQDHLVRRDGQWVMLRRAHRADWMTEGTSMLPSALVDIVPR